MTSKLGVRRHVGICVLLDHSFCNKSSLPPSRIGPCGEKRKNPANCLFDLPVLVEPLVNMGPVAIVKASGDWSHSHHLIGHLRRDSEPNPSAEPLQNSHPQKLHEIISLFSVLKFMDNSLCSQITSKTVDHTGHKILFFFLFTNCTYCYIRFSMITFPLALPIFKKKLFHSYMVIQYKT